MTHAKVTQSLKKHIFQHWIRWHWIRWHRCLLFLRDLWFRNNHNYSSNILKQYCLIESWITLKIDDCLVQPRCELFTPDAVPLKTGLRPPVPLNCTLISLLTSQFACLLIWHASSRPLSNFEGATKCCCALYDNLFDLKVIVSVVTRVLTTAGAVE